MHGHDPVKLKAQWKALLVLQGLGIHDRQAEDHRHPHWQSEILELPGDPGNPAVPPGSLQARMVAYAAVESAIVAERGCGDCAARCAGRTRGNCAGGLDILRAVLAAGVREAAAADGRSLAALPLACAHLEGEASRISAGHALTVLQALHAGGVDVLARGPADELPILHAALRRMPQRWCAGWSLSLARRWRRGTVTATHL
jgi:hypothetical protein